MYHHDKITFKILSINNLIHSLRNHLGSVSALPFLLLKTKGLHGKSIDLQIVRGFDSS